MRNVKTIAAIAGVLVLGGCAYPAGPADYRGYEVRGEQSVRFGVVESVRDVRITPRDTGVGTAGGAALGMVAGSNVGGIIGNNIERSANEHPGLEITVQLDSGKYISVVQGAEEPFRPGERVRILSGRGATRVTH